MTLLAMRGVTKRFGAVEALRGVDFDLQAGEVHALVGENGAGKSTLMKILACVQPLDDGPMTLEARFRNVSDAQARFVVMVYQELALVPALSVAENLFLGALSGIVRYRALRERARALLTQVDLDLDPETAIERLSIGEKQLVEIARALAREGRVLVLDEPTAALSSSETERLFGLIAKVKATGVSVVYISHRLEEIFRIADRVTVLRDGGLVGTRAVSGTTPDEVVEMMVGSSVYRYQRPDRHRDTSLGRFELDLAGEAPIGITVHAGEIVGLAGVIGSGRKRVLPCAFGLSGGARWNGRPIRSPREAIRAGIMLVPSDRKSQNAPGFTGDFSMLLSNNASTGGTCFGDSGGPNFLGDSNLVAGVTSFGLNGNCAGTGGVFRTDRQNVHDFVNEHLNPATD